LSEENRYYDPTDLVKAHGIDFIDAKNLTEVCMDSALFVVTDIHNDDQFMDVYCFQTYAAMFLVVAEI
jgi:hypothetical protein